MNKYLLPAFAVALATLTSPVWAQQTLPSEKKTIQCPSGHIIAVEGQVTRAELEKRCKTHRRSAVRSKKEFADKVQDHFQHSLGR